MPKYFSVVLFSRYEHRGREDARVVCVFGREGILKALAQAPRPCRACCEPVILEAPHGGRLLAGYFRGELVIMEGRIEALSRYNA